MSGLTRVQSKVLDYIRDFIVLNGTSPSVREIGDGVGIKSSSGVAAHIRKLAIRGALTYTPHAARSIKILGAISVNLPPNIEKAVRTLAKLGKCSPEAVIIEALRDRLALVREVAHVLRETKTA